jgi:hypothetical protein
VENKTEIIEKALKMLQISVLPKYVKLIPRVFLCVFPNAGRLKVKINELVTVICNTQILTDLRWGSVHKSTLS